MRRTKSPALPPPRVDDDVHAAFPDVMLVASADAHRSPDHSELRVPEPEGHRAERPLVAAVDVAMPEDHVLAVPGDRDLRPARAVELRLEDVAADVAHRHRIEQAFESRNRPESRAYGWEGLGYAGATARRRRHRHRRNDPGPGGPEPDHANQIAASSPPVRAP
jgi:hypothetical protein